MNKQKIFDYTKKMFKKFKWYEIAYISIGLIAVVALSIIAKSSALTITFSIFGILYVGFLAEQIKISIIFGLIQCVLYVIQSAIYNNWGEFILNVAIVFPLLVISLINWFRGKDNSITVKSQKIGWKEWLILTCASLGVGIAFFFVLRYFDTPYLIFASICGFTATMANYLVLRKSPMSFVVFCVGNIFMFLIWLLPIIEGQSDNFETMPMLAVLIIYTLSNIFGLINWNKTSAKDLKENGKNEEKINLNIKKDLQKEN